jgi:hypothetical protein
MSNISASIASIQRMQDDNLRKIGALSPQGELGEAVRDVMVGAHRYAVSITHVGRYIQTRSGKYRYARPGEAARGGGALRASHRMEFAEDGQGATGRIFIDPSTINPLTGHKPVEYGLYEHRRGGEHAFYARTIGEYGPRALARAGKRITIALRGR